jgi:hypothetical protein
MKLHNARSFALALALLVLAAIPAAAQDSVTGKWLITSTSPEMGSMEMIYELQQDGTTVTGTADLSAIPEIDAVEIDEGLYEDKILSFLLHVSMQGQWFTAEVEADVDGDEMVGETYVDEMGMAMPFTGKRVQN